MKKDAIEKIAAILKKDFERNQAPIIDFMAAQERDPFKILVAVMLSARTKDAMTSKVVREQLFPKIKSLADIRKTSEAELARLIFPVGFFRQKAHFLKQWPEVIDREFGGKIPDTIEELMRLPGVGRKTANLVVAQAFRKPAICVDVHVHRISNRLGLVKTKTPLETEMRLRKILPMKYWIQWNGSLVSFGQRRCLPRNPRCEGCPIREYCATGKNGNLTAKDAKGATKNENKKF